MIGLDVVDGKVQATYISSDDEVHERLITDAEWKEAGYRAFVRDDQIVLHNNQEMKEQEMGQVIRYERMFRLHRCDRVSPLYWESLSEYEKEQCRQYRQELLDITKKKGFPWDGDLKKVPWPDLPKPLAALSYRYDLLYAKHDREDQSI